MSEHTPCISLIVPVYNTAPYLPRCLKACLGQSLHDLEVLAIDDGSSDRSTVILRQYAACDPRLRVFQLEHGGVSLARNYGLEQARGRYVWFIDSDDYPCADAAAALFRTAQEQDAEICRGRPVLVSAGGHEDHQAHEFRLAQRHSSPLFFFSGFWTALFRRSFLKKHRLRFTPGVDLGQDLLFLAAAVLACTRMSLLDQEVYCYCVRPGSADAGSGRLDSARLRRYIRTIEAIAALYYRAQCRCEPAALGYVWEQLVVRLSHIAAGRAPTPADRRLCLAAAQDLLECCPLPSRQACRAWHKMRMRYLRGQGTAQSGAEPAAAPQ